MLKNVPSLLTPALLTCLAEMGHGDVIAVVDSNYPCYTRGNRVIELPGVDAATAIEAILTLMPLETFTEPAVVHMLADDGSEGAALGGVREVWNRLDGREVPELGVLRHGPDGFYARAERAYVTVHTSESAPFGCYLLVKGVL